MLCISCGHNVNSSYGLLCINCWSEIRFIPHQDSTDNAIVEYNHIVQRLIHVFKYKSPWVLCDLFLNWLSLIYGDTISKVDVIIPVPIHKYKVMKRGYNQMVIIARQLARKYKKECLLGILIKTHYTRSQSSLNREARQTNVMGSFTVNKKKASILKNKKILLIDDVITTGATLLECKTVLNDAGIKHIQTICIAITKYE